MKLFLAASFFILSVSYGYTCQVSKANQGINSNFNYDNTAYKSVLPFSRLQGSKDFKIDDANFSVEIGEIIKVAKNLVKKVDKDANWSIESVGLHKYNYSSCTYWYYQINMRSNNYGHNYLYLNIGINGEKPDIYKIKEVLITNE
ncbi:MAG: hypothetical protein GTO02_11415 [Candidatus Dadabacteria bacterium]|nr:hypothetical protein [Candidatus Dadabacteria bacterium]NIQ14966.1 hypothetical protein [Candidatus Dadabacteria bacterium]